MGDLSTYRDTHSGSQRNRLQISSFLHNHFRSYPQMMRPDRWSEVFDCTPHGVVDHSRVRPDSSLMRCQQSQSKVSGKTTAPFQALTLQARIIPCDPAYKITSDSVQAELEGVR